MKIGVYSPNWIGDAVLALPFIKCLKILYPNAKIFIFCKEWVSCVYENNPDVYDIIPSKKDALGTIKGTIKFGLKIRQIKIDHFYTLTDSFRSALVLRISGSPKTVGYKSQMRSFLLTESIEKSKLKIHRYKKYLGLLSQKIEFSINPYIHITSKEKKWGLNEMRKMKINKPVGLFPFSVSIDRTIPKSLIKNWIENADNDYLVFGSKKDIQNGEYLAKSLPKLSIKSICGKYTLRESIILISLCDFGLAADSGLGHISAVLGVPTLSFFGSGSPNITGPIGHKVRIIQHCFPCRGDLCKINNEEVVCLQKISKLDIEDAFKKLTMQ